MSIVPLPCLLKAPSRSRKKREYLELVGDCLAQICILSARLKGGCNAEMLAAGYVRRGKGKRKGQTSSKGERRPDIL